MIEIKELSISIDNHQLINRLSIVVNKHDKIAIIGEEGNGKSTLFSSIMNTLTYGTISGNINILAKNIGFLKQALSKTELEMNVKSFLFSDENAFYLQINQFYKNIAILGISETILDKPIIVLSGGEKVKIQLLKILINKPDILMLDEPSNDLDIATLEWLEGFIQSTNLPLLFISHDEMLLEKCANRIIHLEQLNKQTMCKTTVFNGGYSEYIRIRTNTREKDIQISNQEKTIYKQKKEKLNNIQNALHDALNDTVRDPGKAAMLKNKMKSVKSMDKRIEKNGFSKVDSIEENITLAFTEVFIPAKKQVIDLTLDSLMGGNEVLAQNIHFSVFGPIHIGIIGNNGCGKSTFLNLVFASLKTRPDLKVGYMPQNYDLILKKYRSALNYLNPDNEKDLNSLIGQYLGNLNFTRREMDSPLSQLSSGTKAKLILLKMMIDKCNVLILDEPTRNISPLSNPVVRQSLVDFKGCIISVSHDRKFLSEACQFIYKLSMDGLTPLSDYVTFSEH